MKNLIIVINLTNKHIVGAYPDIETTEAEVTINALNKEYDVRNIFIQPLQNVDNSTYERLINKYKKINIIWN